MSEDESSESSFEETSTTLDYMNKELSNTDLRSEFLAQLLKREEERKVILEARATDLTEITEIDVKERVMEMSVSLKNSLHQIHNLQTNLRKFARENLPSQCEHYHIYVKINRIDQLGKGRDYIFLQYFISFVSTKINSCMGSGDYTGGLSLLRQLRFLHEKIKRKTGAIYLLKYLEETIEAWNFELRDSVSKGIEEILEQVGWPSKPDLTNAPEEAVHELQTLVRCMCELISRYPVIIESPSRPGILADYNEPSPLVNILAKSIRKRFRYHFCGCKATADDSRPDWYFTQVKLWLRDLLPFLGNYLEAITLEESGSSVVCDFVSALSQLLVLKTEKLLSIPNAKVDDTVFSKILEESIRYESDVRSILEELTGNKEAIPGFVNTLFSQPYAFKRWLCIEKQGSLEKLDILFTSSSAWNRVIVPGPTEVAELFSMMLGFMVDRFAHLCQPGQKIQFVQLLVEILDDFRIRCIQVWHSKGDIDNLNVVVAETLGYVHEILKNWEELPFFRTLSFFWDTIRKVEKEDLELRTDTRQRPHSSLEDTPQGEHPQKGLFTEVQERFASSMEMILIRSN